MIEIQFQMPGFQSKTGARRSPQQQAPTRPPRSSPPAQVRRGGTGEKAAGGGAGKHHPALQGSLLCYTALCCVANKEGTWATIDSAAATDLARLAYGS